MFKRKNKEKLDFPLFGPSSSPDSHINPAWEVNAAQTLLRARFEPDLKNTEFNPPRRLRARSETDLENTESNPPGVESYLLDSLWKDLQQTSKAETTASEHSQSASVPVNPPRPMATRFAPLLLLAVLHDLPKIIPREFLYLMGKVI